MDPTYYRRLSVFSSGKGIGNIIGPGAEHVQGKTLVQTEKQKSRYSTIRGFTLNKSITIQYSIPSLDVMKIKTTNASSNCGPFHQLSLIRGRGMDGRLMWIWMGMPGVG